jgi:conjugative relaxase-like TrwC/TraI family protein
MISMQAISDINYYHNETKADYYLGSGEPPGISYGRGAMLLYLQGQISKSDYQAIYTGYAPNGQPLCESPGDKHRAGWDMTFAPDKTLSCAIARAAPRLRKELETAQLNAVKTGIRFLEKHAAITRRGHGGHRQEKVQGLVTTIFHHRTNRLQESQTHHHVLIANIAPRLDGTWGTLESKHLYLWRKSADAVYQNALASEIQKLGFKIQQTETAFKIAGFPERICKLHSKRSEVIKEKLNELGLQSTSSHHGSKVALYTRAHKQAVDHNELLQQWQTEMDEYGFRLDDLNALKTHEATYPAPLPIETILEELVAQKSVVRQQDIYETVAKHAMQCHLEIENIEHYVQALIDEEQVIHLGVDASRNQLYTTPAMKQLEQQLLKQAQQLQQQSQFTLTDSTIAQAVAHFEKQHQIKFSDEQVVAIHSVCQTGFDSFQGAAGSGKTMAMGAINMLHQSQGFEVIGACIAKQAANQLQEETGIPSGTLAKLFNELESGKRNLHNTVLVLDEAGQISSTELQRLTEIALRDGGKILLLGEDKQLNSISHGGSLRYLSEKLGTARVETIRRQREEWAREAVAQLRVGDCLPALEAHQKRGLLYWHDKQTDCIRDCITQWHRYQQLHPKKQSLMLAHRWEQVNLLSKQARHLQQAEGRVGTENIPFDCWVADRQMSFEYSVGDRIKLTKNDYRKGLTNGTFGTITEIKQLYPDIYQFSIKADDGRQLQIRSDEYCNDTGQLYMALGYAMTIYSSQGASIDGDVFVLHNTQMDRANTYVAGSRHKDNCHWFIDRAALDAHQPHNNDQERLHTLAKSMSQDNQPNLTLDYLDQHEMEL